MIAVGFDVEPRDSRCGKILPRRQSRNDRRGPNGNSDIRSNAGKVMGIKTEVYAGHGTCGDRNESLTCPRGRIEVVAEARDRGVLLTHGRWQGQGTRRTTWVYVGPAAAGQEIGLAAVLETGSTRHCQGGKRGLWTGVSGADAVCCISAEGITAVGRKPDGLPGEDACVGVFMLDIDCSSAAKLRIRISGGERIDYAALNDWGASDGGEVPPPEWPSWR